MGLLQVCSETSAKRLANDHVRKHVQISNLFVIVTWANLLGEISYAASDVPERNLCTNVVLDTCNSIVGKKIPADKRFIKLHCRSQVVLWILLLENLTISWKPRCASC